MKRLIVLCEVLLVCFQAVAQDAPHENYPQWPADKPEAGFIEDAQSKTRAENYDLLPQEVAMQDRMRTIFTDMMQNASAKLGWQMVELSEYTNENPMQGGGIPYDLRSPRGIDITFQFIVNKNSLQAWKAYETGYGNQHLAKQQNNYSNTQSATQSPLYKRYKDSLDYYTKLYLQYTEAHKDEGVALYTKDEHPIFYRQKESEFINKMTAMTDEVQNNSGIQQAEEEHDLETVQFRNNTVVQVEFHVNIFTSIAIDKILGPVEFSSVAYPLPHAVLSKLYTVEENQVNKSHIKWKNIILVLVGNFLTKPNDEGYYDAGFNHNSQGDEHTPKKIKSDKVQNISININGDKPNIVKMVKLIDMDKLNSTIVK